MDLIARFTTPLRVEKIGERRWMLTDSLVFYTVALRGTFVVPRGFQTDYASIPRFFWRLFPPVGLYDAAAVLHDAAYASALLTLAGDRVYIGKALSDYLFQEALQACKVGWVQTALMYRAVSLFGDPDAHPLEANAAEAAVSAPVRLL